MSENETHVPEPDPENHDVAAGEEFRQRGDWTADEAGGPQVVDSSGQVVEEGGERVGEGVDHGSDVGESSLDEVRDGGYSVGSAAPLDAGRQPLGHPVKAWEDTKTYLTQDMEGYDAAAPHVWFTDPGAAENAGFRRAD